MSDRPVLLAIDDDAGMLVVVRRFAERYGFEVVTHSDPAEALRALPSVRPNAVIADVRMPSLDGLAVLRAVRAADPLCQVILMTGHADVDTAVEAVKLGALDYLSKPLDPERVEGLLTTIRKDLERRERLLHADAALARECTFHGMIGRSPAMQELFDAIRRLAPHVRTVLVSGETGTGKELVARALHTLGPRRDRRFVTLNCSAVVETLFESELFGHQRGAFTGATEAKAGLFEHAHGGTLFLDEIGELPIAMQAKLLRAIEYGEVQRVGALEGRKVDVRVVAATNRDLRGEAATGRFRGDLFYRLSAVELRLPPLRSRREDIGLLAAACVQEMAERLGRPLSGMTAAAEEVLKQASWEGNVRELRNVIERACLLSSGRMLSERDILRAMPHDRGRLAIDESTITAANDPSSPDHLPDRLDAAQRLHILRALHNARGNKSEAARRLGITRRSLYRWLKRLNLEETLSRDTP